jgi:hypothetical protein
MVSMTGATTAAGTTAAGGGTGGNSGTAAALDAACGHQTLNILTVTIRASDVVIAPKDEAFKLLLAFVTLIFIDGHLSFPPFFTLLPLSLQ